MMELARFASGGSQAARSFLTLLGVWLGIGISDWLLTRRPQWARLSANP